MSFLTPLSLKDQVQPQETLFCFLNGALAHCKCQKRSQAVTLAFRLSLLSTSLPGKDHNYLDTAIPPPHLKGDSETQVVISVLSTCCQPLDVSASLSGLVLSAVTCTTAGFLSFPLSPKLHCELRTASPFPTYLLDILVKGTWP